MGRNNQKSIIVSNQSIFNKIKEFFKSIFSKKSSEEIYNYHEETNEQNSNTTNFLDEIKIKPNIEAERIVKLQSDYEAGVISDEEMTDEQISELNNLYKEQISKLTNEYKEYEFKINLLKKKMATNKALASNKYKMNI